MDVNILIVNNIFSINEAVIVKTLNVITSGVRTNNNEILKTQVKSKKLFKAIYYF